MFIDTHAHLNFKDYEKMLDEVVQRSLDNNVEKIICVSSNIEDSKKAIEVSKKFPDVVYSAVGIHPQCTDPGNKDLTWKQLGQLETLVKENDVIAIGECGLDDTEPPPEERRRDIKEQKELFLGQIKLAIRYNLPILIHCNKAYENLEEIFIELGIKNKESGGVFHFYSGGKKRLKKFLEYNNFLFGVTGTITYEEGIQNVIKEIPLDRLVLETDCPFLAPEPHRGERNEPSYIPLIAKKVAEVKSVGSEEVERVTTDNAVKLFGLE